MLFFHRISPKPTFAAACVGDRFADEIGHLPDKSFPDFVRIQIAEREATEDRRTRNPFKILLVVGLIVLGSALLAAYHSLNWLWLSGIAGAQLIQASFTGNCPVVMTRKVTCSPNQAEFA